MIYDEIILACEQLSYKDKLRLAQLLIQTARKEEENANPEPKIIDKTEDIDVTEYVAERLLKLKPVKQQSLANSIKTMFQFQGGIAESDIDRIIAELQKRKYIKIEQNKVSYL